MAHNKKGTMTVQDAGRKGGEATSKELHGTGFYREIGHEGGVTAARNQHKGQFATGQKGGKSQAHAHSDTNQKSQQNDKNDNNDKSDNEESWLDKIF